MAVGLCIIAIHHSLKFHFLLSSGSLIPQGCKMMQSLPALVHILILPYCVKHAFLPDTWTYGALGTWKKCPPQAPPSIADS